MQSSLFRQEPSQEPWMLCIIVVTATKILKPSCQDRCLAAVILVLSVINLPPTYLVEDLMASSQWMVLSARVFICAHLTLLLRISFHMSKNNESNLGGISHTLPIPPDSIHVVQKMEISTGTVTEISLAIVIILESTGGHLCHASLVTKAFPACTFLGIVSFILYLDLVK